jgi:hypothetical protein
MWGDLPDERMGLTLTIAAGLRQRILVSEYRGPHDHILLSQIRDSPNLEVQVPVVITPGTGFSIRRLLRLAGLWWRYSNGPPRGDEA